MIGTVAGAADASVIKSAPLAARAPGVALAVASMTTIQLGAALSEPLWDRHRAVRRWWPFGSRSPR